jgi:hypothetical protein
LFFESLLVGASGKEFAREQERMVLDVFLSEIEEWSWEGENPF